LMDQALPLASGGLGRHPRASPARRVSEGSSTAQPCFRTAPHSPTAHFSQLAATTPPDAHEALKQASFHPRLHRASQRSAGDGNRSIHANDSARSAGRGRSQAAEGGGRRSIRSIAQVTGVDEEVIRNDKGADLSAPEVGEGPITSYDGNAPTHVPLRIGVMVG
jgi:hypothetical protein